MLSVNCLIGSHQLFSMMRVAFICCLLEGGERMETSSMLLKEGWKVKIFFTLKLF